MKFDSLAISFALATLSHTVFGFIAPSRLSRSNLTFLREGDQIISPFDHSGDSEEQVATSTLPPNHDKGPLDLTWENVEKVLDDMRPFLIQDGGNVSISDIDGPVVKLQLEVSTRFDHY